MQSADLSSPPLADEARTSARSVGVAMLVAASILWSLSGVVLKYLNPDPIAFTFYRSLAAAVPMGILVLFTTGRRPAWRWMLLSIPLHLLVVSTLIVAMAQGTAAAGILLQYTAPIFCAVLAWIFQRRRIGQRTLLALVIGTVGILVMLLARPAQQNLMAPILGVVSGLAFAGLILTLEKIDRVAGGGVNPFFVVFCNNAGTALILLPLCLAQQRMAIQPFALGIIGATGMIQLALPYVLFQYGLRRVNPVDATLLVLLEPVLNPVWVAIVVGERPDTGTILGGIAILAALVIEATKPSTNAAGD